MNLYFCCCTFYCIVPAFIHMHCCTSFRYARCTMCARGVEVEPQDGVRWTSPENGRTRGSNRRPGPMVGRAQGLASINTNLVLPSGKPRCMSYYFNLWITICIYYLCTTFQELFEILVVWSLGFSGPYTSMDRSVALLCLIGLDRSRVITCHSRDIGYVYIPVHELLNLIWNE